MVDCASPLSHGSPSGPSAAGPASAAPTLRWYLSGGVDSRGEEQQIAISVEPFSIGRSRSNVLCLGDSTISGRHASLERVGETLILHDLGSTNGTFVNGRRVTSPVPVGDGDLLQFGATAMRLVAVGDESRGRTVGRTTRGQTLASAVDDNALALFQLGQMLCSRDAFAQLQPIVELLSGDAVGFEALGRSRVVGLETPAAMFAAATRLGSEVELSELLREAACAAGSVLPAGCLLFVNTHPAESDVSRLLRSVERARCLCPRARLVLEIHEGAVTDPYELRRLRDRLLELEIRLAFDDFGAGQSRLLELAEVRPDIVKFDRRLVAQIDEATPDRQRMLASLVSWSLDFGIVPLAEGVETEAEAECCRDLGFTLAQGYLFGRPAGVDDALRRRLRIEAPELRPLSSTAG